MKKIAVIGANSFQNKLILKAKDLGYTVYAFAWVEGAVGAKNCDKFFPISITEKEKIAEICKDLNIDAVLSVASDLAMPTVSYVAEKLGLVSNSSECVKLTTNKYLMRDQLAKSIDFTPKFKKVDLENRETALQEIESEFNLPIIVKPTDRSGSRGITKLDNFLGLSEAIDVAVENSFEKSAIVEEYIDGEEYSCECISFAGEHNFLAVTRKFTTNAPHFIETGHIQPSGLDKKEISSVKQAIFQALDSLKIEYGASHSEFKIDKDGNVKIIEIGARMGGDCIGSDLVMLSTGYDFLKMVIDVALGKKPEIVRTGEQHTAQIKFIFSQADLDELNRIKEENPDIINYVSEIDEIGSREVVDSSTRFGYYILAY